MLKAKHLEKGNTIGVVSPASPSENRSEIVRAKEEKEPVRVINIMEALQKSLVTSKRKAE